MKKSKDPLGWYFDNKEIPIGNIIKIRLGLADSITESISYSFSSSWTTSDYPWNYMISVGGKKTLNVTKNDIKVADPENV